MDFSHCLKFDFSQSWEGFLIKKIGTSAFLFSKSPGTNIPATLIFVWLIGTTT